MGRKLFFIFLIFQIGFRSFGQNTDSLENILSKAIEDTNKVILLNNIANDFMGPNPQQAYIYANNALKLSQKLSYDKGIALSYKLMGNANYLQGNLKQARVYYEASLAIAEKSGDTTAMANCYNNLGNVCTDEGNFDKALEYLFAGLRIQEATNNKKGISNGYLNIGNVFKYQNDIENALKYYEKSLLYAEEIDLKINIANAHNNIGTLLNTQKKFEKAIESLEKAFNEHTIIDNKRGIAITLLNLGDVYQQMEKLEKSLEYYERAYKAASDMNDKLLTGLLLVNKGSVDTKLKKFDSALKNLQNGLDLLKTIGAKDEVGNTYGALATYYETKGDLKNALQYHKQFKSLKDSLLNAEKNEQIAKMHTIYETEKKDKENIVLKEKQKLQEAENSRKNIALTAVAIGLFMVVVIAFMLFRNNQQKQKTNKILTEQAEELKVANEQITMQNQELTMQKEEITAQKDAIQLQGIEIERKNSELLHKNEQISNSIRAAQLIQQAILPHSSKLQKVLGEHFVFYQPKDVVSGDFYWLDVINDNQTLLAAIDCTGHGVPGALMSMIAYSIIDRIVHIYKITDPAQVLSMIHQEIETALLQKETGNRDGMDIGLCLIEKNKDGSVDIIFAGAKRPLYCIINGQVEILKGERKSIGGLQNKNVKFENHTIHLPLNSTFYLSTDGFTDQNDMERQKFGENRLLNDLLQNAHLSMEEQKMFLTKHMKKHQIGTEQRDDMLIIGVRV